MTRLFASLRRAARALFAESRRDEGVIGLVIAIALIAAAAALIATTARRSQETTVARAAANAKAAGNIERAIISYFLTGASGTAAYRLPCPDSNVVPDGLENNTGSTCGTLQSGVVPYETLRLNRDDVIDAYGNYFTYVVSASGLQMCGRVTNGYDSSSSFDGATIDATDTEALLTTQSAGSSLGVPFYYAIISHGPNGLGAISSDGSRRPTPSSASERQNCPESNTNCTRPSNTRAVFTGPATTPPVADTAKFDDKVFLGEQNNLEEFCDRLTNLGPDGDIDANFNTGGMPSALSTAASTGTGTVTVENSAVTGRSRTLRFTGSDPALSTTRLNFDPLGRPNYVKFEWTPTAATGAGRAGMAVGTRATSAARTAGTAIFDNTAGFNDGITIQYFENADNNSNGVTSNRIYICDETTTACNSGSRLAQSGTFTIALNTTYDIELMDDGRQIWARITQSNLATNTAVVSLDVATARQDNSGQSTIMFLSFANSTSELDNLLVKRGGMAANFNGAGQIIETAGDVHDTASRNLTLEAWVRPNSLPTGTVQRTIIAKWNDDGAGATAEQSYRLYLASGGLSLDITARNAADTAQVAATFTSGFSPTAAKWSHVAASFNRDTATATFYIDGRRVASRATTLFTTDTGVAARGVNNSSGNTFTVGANRQSAAVDDRFLGDITDVRVWSTVRTPQEIVFNRRKRLRLSSTALTGLIVNWTMDRDTSALFAAPSAGTTAAGDATATDTTPASGSFAGGASLVGIRQNHIPPNANAICPAGVRARAFKCDYRTTAQGGVLTMADNLGSMFFKAWGGGGGYYDDAARERVGGGAGMSAGRLSTISTTSLPDLSGSALSELRITVGGAGTESATVANNGAGGGGASGAWLDTGTLGTLGGTDRAGIIGGGGGGASYGDDSLSAGATIDCSTGTCGPGGIGGGPSNIAGLSDVATARATSAGVSACGGRGGDSASFAGSPSAADDSCDGAGGDPTSSTGVGDAAGSATGGVSLIGSGGNGFNAAANRIGAGGAGGGVTATDFTTGGGEAGGYDDAAVTSNGADANGTGFGGGGGGGFADTTAYTAYGKAASYPGPSTNIFLPGNVTGSSTTTDPDFAPDYCNSGANCSVTPGYGGQVATPTAARPGAVIIKW